MALSPFVAVARATAMLRAAADSGGGGAGAATVAAIVGFFGAGVIAATGFGKNAKSDDCLM
jgi:hypothetical protein